MFLALEEAPFVLQGPKPTVPPGLWESSWPSGLIVLGLITLAVVAVRRFLGKRPATLTPLAELELGLRLAETQPRPEAIAQASRAFRHYLAALEPRAAISLSTEELFQALAGLPLFLPARQPLLAALRSADAAKFAGAALEAPLLIAGLREAAKRIEDARRTFSRPVVIPVVPPRPRTPDEPPPLPGPPPLPRRNHA